MKFIYETGDVLDLDKNCLLVFLDETGDEKLSDKNYPLFGIGGCCIPISIYESNIINPWNYLKEKEFNGKDTRMHASELKPNRKQIEILNKFFSTCAFGRIATTISKQAVNNNNIDNYEIIARCTYDRIREIANSSVVNQIAIFFEESQRGDKLAQRYFQGYDFIKEKSKIEILRGKMPKSSLEPGLEVADFIIHTAGGQTNRRLSRKEGFRKDYDMIFRNYDKRLTSFLEITSLKKN